MSSFRTQSTLTTKGPFLQHLQRNPSFPFAAAPIGLAICKRIVEQHNGIIVATGKPDQGAQFIIWLPVKQAVPTD